MMFLLHDLMFVGRRSGFCVETTGLMRGKSTLWSRDKKPDGLLK